MAKQKEFSEVEAELFETIYTYAINNRMSITIIDLFNLLFFIISIGTIYTLNRYSCTISI